MTARPGLSLGNVLGKRRRPFAPLPRSAWREGAFMPSACSREGSPGRACCQHCRAASHSRTRGTGGGSVKGPMGLPCVKNGRFAHLNTEIGALAVISGRLLQASAGHDQDAMEVAGPSQPSADIISRDLQSESVTRPAESPSARRGRSPQKHSAGTEGPVRQTLRRSEANGPFRVPRTFLRGTPRRASG